MDWPNRQVFNDNQTALRLECFSRFIGKAVWWLMPATAPAGDRKRACFPFRCPCVCTRHNYFFCLVFGTKFNIMSTLFVHETRTLPQKIDSREGLFWCKTGLCADAGEMDVYLRTPPFAPVLGLFAAKCSAFSTKMECVLVLNRVRFGAKRKAFWC